MPTMITRQGGSRKQYGLRALAVILLLFGGVLIYIGSHNFAIRFVGLAVVMVSVYLVQASNVHNRSGLPEASGEVNRPIAATAPGRLLWMISLSLVPVVAGAWYLLHLDALNGGQTAWPAYLFAGVAVVCAVVWGLLVVSVSGGRRWRN